MLVLIGGIVEWGWAMRTQTAVVSAAREGARAGAGTAQDDDPETTAETRAALMLEDAGLNDDDATITATQSGSSPDTVIVVDIAIEHPSLMPLVPTLDTLRASSTMRMQEQP